MSYYTLGEYVDSDIQVVGTSGIVDCGFCSMNLNSLSLRERDEHYEHHFDSASGKRIIFTSQGDSHTVPSTVPLGSSQSSRLSLPSNKFNQRSEGSQNEFLRKMKSSSKGNAKGTENTRRDGGVFWHRGLSSPPPRNYTQGLIPLLRKALWSSHALGTTLRAALCNERVVHVSQTSLDIGWGFDPQGAQQLKKLVGTKKWLGTAGYYLSNKNALIFTFSIRPLRGVYLSWHPVSSTTTRVAFCASCLNHCSAELVDFHLDDRPEGKQNYSHPAQADSASINEALRGASPIVVTDRMPIILQRQGHSRTIIGYEIAKTGKIKLLMFEPAMKINPSTKAIAQTLFAPSSFHQKRLLESPDSALQLNAKRPRSKQEKLVDEDDDNDVLIIESSLDRRLPQDEKKTVFENVEESTKSLQKFLDQSRLHTRKLGCVNSLISYSNILLNLIKENGISDIIFSHDAALDRDGQVQKENGHQ
ncbi:hypothetical protein H0H87_006039 [Tephrocybe sp. NHM501043]|nr:hypothetical protein H0H87_006039 [Tephrocybe sp. NHM501043]